MVYLLSITALVLLLAIGITTSANLGILGFTAAFVIGGWVSGMSVTTVLGLIPANIFVTVVGVTLLFGIAQANGTVEVLVDGALKLVGGRRWAIVWLMFVLGAAIMSAGQVVAVVMLAPLAMQIAKRYSIDPLLMGAMLGHGAFGASFSPVTVYGVYTNDWMKSEGLHANPLALYLIPLGLSFLLALGLFLVRGRGLIGGDDSNSLSDSDNFGQLEAAGPDSADGRLGAEGVQAAASAVAVAVEPPPPIGNAEEALRLTPIRVLTLIGILAMLVGAVAFSLDVGVTAMAISAVLLVLAPRRHKTAVNHIAWNAVLLVSGVLTFMNVLKKNGTIAHIGHAVASVHPPLLTALIFCFVIIAIAAVGSSFGTLGTALPLAAPLLATGHLGALGFVAAVAFSVVMVDISPIHSNGSMIVVNAPVPDRDRFQRSLFGYTAYVATVSPILAWLLIVVPTTVW